ncbi:MAG TPA: hypothetical protein VF855_03650 [Acidimicrobiales bacterium]
MRVAIVVETSFGNTRRAAKAIADGFGEQAEVVLHAADDHWDIAIAGADLLVLGAPTHTHGLSTADSRALAASERGAPATGGVRDFLEVLPRGHGRAAAAFDTRFADHHGPAAADRIAHRLRKLGYHLVLPPKGFLVDDVDGPLSLGQLERARVWGAELARVLQPA